MNSGSCSTRSTRCSANSNSTSGRVSRSALETESQRTYLKAVLERLSTGVLGLDRDGVLRTANHAAETILEAPLSRYVGQHLSSGAQRACGTGSR